MTVWENMTGEENLIPWPEVWASKTPEERDAINRKRAATIAKRTARQRRIITLKKMVTVTGRRLGLSAFNRDISRLEKFALRTKHANALKELEKARSPHWWYD